MKKTIQATLAILIILFFCMGYTSNYIAAENPNFQSSKDTIHEAYIDDIVELENINKVTYTKPIEPESSIIKADAAQGILNNQEDTGLVGAQVNDNTLKPEMDGLEKETSLEEEFTDITALKRELDPNKPMVALTFDDGPHPKYTAEILESLKENDAVATFFVVGSRAEKYKNTIKSIVEGGNEIGNHTYDHKELTKLSKKEIEYEITKTSNILKSITGKAPTITRPTYGSINKNVRLYAGSPLVLWSIDTMDWKSRNKNKIVNITLKNVKDGDIILMHDIYKSTADAAKVVIKELKSKGYQMVTVSELYQAREVTLENGQAYHKCTPKSSVKK